MDNSLQHQIADILAQQEEVSDIPTLHVFLIDGEEPNEEGNAVEGSLEGVQADPETDQEQIVPEGEQGTTQEQAGPQHPMSWEYPLWARVIGLLGVVIFFGPALLVPVGVPVFQLPITVMIEPKTAQLELETDITLPARQLSALTLSQSKTVQTTGKGYQPAKAAQGLVSLYNAALFPQTIEAGAFLIGASGVGIVIDQDVTIPPGTLATNGQATVGAHALQPGTEGNIRAGEIYGPCCRANVFATNGKFTGGKDARSYPMVTEQDREQAANDLGASLENRIQDAFEALLQSGEALTSPQCQPIVASTHKAGDEAKHVSITVTFTCGASAYRIEQFQQSLHFKLYLYGAEQLSSCYQQRGEATILTLSGKALSERVILTVKARATYTYQFTETLFDLYKQAIAGKSKRDAVMWLKQQPGVAQATITEEQLPREASIQFVLIAPATQVRSNFE